MVLLSAYADLLPHYHAVLQRKENINEDRPPYSSCSHCPTGIYCEFPVAQDLIEINTIHYPMTYHRCRMKAYIDYIKWTIINFGLTTPYHTWDLDEVTGIWTCNKVYNWEEIIAAGDEDEEMDKAETQEDLEILLEKKGRINKKIEALIHKRPYLKQFLY